MDSNELLKKLTPGFAPEENFSSGMLVTDPSAALKAQAQATNPELERMRELLNRAQSRSIASAPTATKLPAAATISEAPSVQADTQEIEKAEETTAPQNDLTYAGLQQALDAKNNMELGGGLLRGGNMIAEAFSQGRGGNFKVDPGIYADIARRAQAPVDNFKTKLTNVDSIQMSDPASDISKFAREQAQAQMKKLNPEFDVKKLDKMSAAQLEKLGFKFTGQQSSFADRVQQTDYETLDGQPLVLDPTTKQYRNLLTGEAHTGDVRRKILQGFFDPRSGERVLTDSRGRTTQIGGQGAKLPQNKETDASLPKTPITPFEIKDRVSANTWKDIQKAKDEFIKETDQSRQIVAGLDGVKDMIALAEKNPASKPIAAAAITRLFEKGVLTNQDVVRYIERQGIFNSAEDYISRVTSGTFNNTQAMQLAQALNAYKSQQEGQIRNIANQKAENMLGYIDPNSGITQSDLSNMMYTPVVSKSKASSKTQDLIKSRSDEDNLKRLQELKAKYGR